LNCASGARRDEVNPLVGWIQCLLGVCVLVVEDEPIVALDLVSTLEDAGADVVGPAYSLTQADRLSDNIDIAVAVLDVRLGNQTIASVASKLHDRGVPIIFHTGHGSTELTSQWPRSRVVVKPARAEDLLSAIMSLLNVPERPTARAVGD
jgi:DNA-binding response OmpR family regulator